MQINIFKRHFPYLLAFKRLKVCELFTFVLIHKAVVIAADSIASLQQ